MCPLHRKRQTSVNACKFGFHFGKIQAVVLACHQYNHRWADVRGRAGNVFHPHFPECAGADAAALISTRTPVTCAVARTVVISLLFAGRKFAALALKRMLLRGI
jgi:hypothetical protein